MGFFCLEVDFIGRGHSSWGISVLGCPGTDGTLGSIGQDQWVISPTYKWGASGFATHLWAIWWISLDIEMRCKRNLGVRRLEKVCVCVCIYIYIFHLYKLYIYIHPGGRSRRSKSLYSLGKKALFLVGIYNHQFLWSACPACNPNDLCFLKVTPPKEGPKLQSKTRVIKGSHI